MLRNRIVALGVTALAAVFLAGCNDNDADTTATAAAPTSAAPAAAPVASAAPEATLDDGSKKACTNLAKDIKSGQKKIAEADAVGGPAGHFAVSAAYSAAAAQLYVSMNGAGEKVNAAAEGVADAYTDLADKYGSGPKKAPSKAALTSALKELDAACAG